MATKSNYLALINKVLKRINQTVVVAVPTTGHGAIIAELINEAQNYLYTETDWYSLYSTRMWQSYSYSASTISFDSAGTINDSANGLASFTAGCLILVSGSDSNDYVFQVSTVAAGTLTLTSDEVVTTEAAGDSITITQLTYAVASDFGRGLSLQDTTNNILLTEDSIRVFSALDPQEVTTGIPVLFGVDSDFYKFDVAPAGTYRYREYYIATPTALSATTDTSSLPIECENPIIHYAYYQMLNYLQRYEIADRERYEFEKQLAKAKASNMNKINQLHRMLPGVGYEGIVAPRFPSGYGPRTFGW